MGRGRGYACPFGASMDEAAAEVVVVGAASRDVVDDDPRGWRLGGGVTYAALTLARLGFRVGALVGVDDAASASPSSTCSARPASTSGSARRPRARLRQRRDADRSAPARAAGVGPDRPGGLPEAWRPRAPGCSPRSRPRSTRRGRTSHPADPWSRSAGRACSASSSRRARRAARPGAIAVVRRADLVGVSREDLVPGTPPEALAEHLHPGATLLVTDAREAASPTRSGPVPSDLARRYPAVIPIRRDVDPTGAGDVFLAGHARGVVDPSIAAGYDGPGPGPAPRRRRAPR